MRRTACLVVATALAALAAGRAVPAPSPSRLVMAIPQDPGSPLNLYVTSHSRFDALLDLVYDKLFAPSPYMDEPIPWLAESAQPVDPWTWVVRLRSGIRWHDGRPFSAEDVRFTFTYYRDGPQNRHSHHVSEVPHIKDVVATDPRTVRFVCAYPCPTLRRITLADLPILPRHVWEGIPDPRAFSGLPVGTGPYRLVEYRTGHGLRFVANPAYFRGRPRVAELVVPVIPEPATTFGALRRGEVHAAARPVPPELLQAIGNSSVVRVVRTRSLTLAELRLNFERWPLDDPAVRRALSLAIDRESLVRIVLLGRGRPGTRGYPHPDSPWTNPALRTPYRPGAARGLLEERGFLDRDGDGVRESPDRRPLRFVVKVPSNEPVLVRAAELVGQQLQRVGIRAAVQALDPGAVAALFRTRDFDLVLDIATPHAVADPDQFVMSHRSGYLWRKGLPYPEMDTLVDAWMAARTVEGRKRVLFQMQELFNRQPTSIALWYPDEFWAFRRDAYDGWAASPGYGIFHKFSLLAPSVRAGTVLEGR
jgi:peptide/nickel transport system substrate-binding protein